MVFFFFGLNLFFTFLFLLYRPSSSLKSELLILSISFGLFAAPLADRGTVLKLVLHSEFNCDIRALFYSGAGRVYYGSGNTHSREYAWITEDGMKFVRVLVCNRRPRLFPLHIHGTVYRTDTCYHRQARLPDPPDHCFSPPSGIAKNSWIYR